MVNIKSSQGFCPRFPWVIRDSHSENQPASRASKTLAITGARETLVRWPRPILRHTAPRRWEMKENGRY